MTEYMNMANISYAVEFPKRSIDEIVKLVNTIPEPQPVPLKYVIPLLSYAMKLQAENAHLKAQLRWRPVSEKPEESCKCIGKFDDGELYDALVYYDAKNDLWSRLVHDTIVGWYTSYKPPIKYFIIPPAPEVI